MPTDEERAGLQTDAAAIFDRLRHFGITLTPDEQRTLLHARKDADPMVRRIHDLSVKYGINIPGASLEGLERDMVLRNLLHPIVDILRAATKVAEDTMNEAESEMWQAFLSYYGTLAHMSKTVPELKAELQPVVEFMAKRHPRNAGPTTPPA